MPEYTAEVVGVGTLRLLDAIKTCGLEKSVKFYQASTSELFGKVQEVPQTEKTAFYPRQGPLKIWTEQFMKYSYSSPLYLKIFIKSTNFGLS